MRTRLTALVIASLLGGVVCVAPVTSTEAAVLNIKVRDENSFRKAAAVVGA